MKATIRPSGETRTLLTQPAASWSTFRSGTRAGCGSRPDAPPRGSSRRATSRRPHGLEDLAGRSAGQRHPRESPDGFVAEQVVAIEGDRELAARRDREKSAPAEAERARLGAVGPRREDLEGAPVPGRSVDDRLAIRSEARGSDRSARESQPLEARRAVGAGAREATQRGSPRRRPARSAATAGSEPAAARCLRGLGRLEAAGEGSLRQVVAHALQVPREILGRGVALFGVLGEAALDDPAHGRREPSARAARAARAPRG